MNPLSLQNYLKSVIEMSHQEADIIAEYFKEESILKNELILKPGQVSKKSYYLETGCIRSYVLDLDGNEVTTRIFTAPDFLNDYLSFFKKEPGKEYYKSINDCVVRTIDYEAVQICFHNIPKFREWGRMMLTLNYETVKNQMISLHTETAEQRYVNLVRDNFEIAKVVPLKFIASYLGITDSSLSRIRKKLASS